MAKKQDTTPDEAAKTNPDAAPPAADKKPAGEKKPRKPKDAEPNAPAPAADGAPAPVAAPAPSAAAGPADGTKKKKKKPGTAPYRGKKLRNHLNNIQQKLQKEGAMPLKKAVNTLKSFKRSKMD